MVAFAIDSLLAIILAFCVSAPFSVAAAIGAPFLNDNFLYHYSMIDIIRYLVVVTYFVLFTYFMHSTLGKKLLRLEVVTEDETWTFFNVFYRETIGRFLSSLLCIGYLVVIGNDKNQGFHDMLCDTYVVYKDAVLKKAQPEVVQVKSVQEEIVTEEVM